MTGDFNKANLKQVMPGLVQHVTSKLGGGGDTQHWFSLLFCRFVRVLKVLLSECCSPPLFYSNKGCVCVLFSQLMGSLEEVHMPQNGINHPGVTALAKAMQHNTGLRTLNLNDNTFTEKGALAMAQVHRHQTLGS